MKCPATFRLPGPAAGRVIDYYSNQIPDPLERLRFLRKCMEVDSQYISLVRHWPFCRWMYRFLFSESVSRASRISRPPHRRGENRLLRIFLRENNLPRRLATGLVASVLAMWFVGGLALTRREHARPDLERLHERPEVSPGGGRLGPADMGTPLEIWLVETKEEMELYSNGLRILNNFVTHTGPRLFPVFSYGPGAEPSEVTWRDRPVGLVFHTTESDLAPLEKSNNHLIRYQGLLLLRYIQRKKLYNFVVDRFGRVYRVVPETEYAYHAGQSMWAEGEELYVNLNESFIGISFETRPGAAKPEVPPKEGVTPAQLAAGRLLTEMLCHKFGIVAGNAVTHEMVSLNPGNMRIGYHTDWRGHFPFEEVGFPDNYQLLMPSVAQWGFRYDSRFVQEMGGQVWPGIRRSQEKFRREADARNTTVENYRNQQEKRFRRLIKRVSGIEAIRSPSQPGPQREGTQIESGEPGEAGERTF